MVEKREVRRRPLRQNQADGKWIPRETYEYVMSKLDACSIENSRLRAELRETKAELSRARAAARRQDW